VRATLLLRTATSAVFPFVLVVAAYLFIRGHDAPGGGFIAGLVASAAVILQYLAFGLASIRSAWRLDYRQVTPIGLLLATVTGLIPMAAGLPFLTSGGVEITLPFLGSLKLLTTLFFDLGVALVVLGMTLGVVDVLGADEDAPPGAGRQEDSP